MKRFYGPLICGQVWAAASFAIESVGWRAFAAALGLAFTVLAFAQRRAESRGGPGITVVVEAPDEGQIREAVERYLRSEVSF